MTDEIDDLSRPLGQTPRAVRRFSLPMVLSVVVVTGLVVSGVLIYAFMGPIIGSRSAAKKSAAKPAVGSGSETAKTRPEIIASPPVAARPEPELPVQEADAVKERTITIIDGTSGERTSVIIPSGVPRDKTRDKRQEP